MRKPNFLSLFLSSFTLTICLLFPYPGAAMSEITTIGKER